MHIVKLNKYRAQTSPMRFGTWGSQGIEQIKVEAGEGWENLTITATFVVGNKYRSEAVLVPVDGIISVPDGATAIATTDGVIVFRGTDGFAEKYSTNARYIVEDRTAIDGDITPTPTPSLWQQYIAEVGTYRNEASGASVRAQRAETNANAAQVAAESAKTEAVRANEQAKQYAESAGNAKIATDNNLAEANKANSSAQSAKQSAESAATRAEQSASTASDKLIQIIQNADTVNTAKSETLTASQNAVSAKQSAEQYARQALSARDVAQTSATQAQTAQTASETAKTAAQTAATTAQSYTNNPPKIGDNGNWMLWNGKQYVDSGFPSKGAQGIQGIQGERGAQGVPGRDATIDTTLSKSGQAADAKSTGDALAQLLSESKEYTDNKIAEYVPKNSLERLIADYYALRRTGRVYTTKLWHFATNPSSAGEKLDDNAGLVFEPSTDTYEGRDDYANIPLFEWKHVNYIREEDGSPIPIALEGTDEYKTTGSVDVGAMQMSFWWKLESNIAEGYDLISITDMPREGYVPWCECVKADGTVMPWCIGSAYFSGVASDGLWRSQPNLPIKNFVSHNTMITEYGKKGAGYQGAGACRNTFQYIFNAIKGATKNSQTLYAGCTNYNYQYDASIQSNEANTYIPILTSQANDLIVGSYVAIGHASNNNGTLNKDRGQATVRKYVKCAKITKIEALDESNSAVYIDTDTPFNTMPVALTDTLSAPIMISTMPWGSGLTDCVKGHHDGSAVSNANSRFPYRVQGREYAIGAYSIASDTVLFGAENNSREVYVAPKGVKHSNSDSVIKSTYTKFGEFSATTDFWIGDIGIDISTGSWYPETVGGSDRQGVGDRCYYGGTFNSGSREYLQGGLLWSGSDAGCACLHCWHWLGYAFWFCAAAD